MVLLLYADWARYEDHDRSSDDLYRRAKSEAALRGRKLKDLVEEGLRLVLETPRHIRRRPSLAGLMKGARGAVDSRIADLASNPESSHRLWSRCGSPSLTPDRWSLFSTGRNNITAGLSHRLRSWTAPLLVCEPVLAEAMYLLARFSEAQDALFGLLENGALTIAFHIEEHVASPAKVAAEISGQANVAR